MSNRLIEEHPLPENRPVVKTPKPLNLKVFYGFIALAVVAIVFEVIFFPNLLSNPIYLALVVLTTLFSIGSIGLTISGLRSRISRPANLGVRLGVWVLVVLDVIFLVLPNFISGPAANDGNVSFVGSASTVSSNQNGANLTGFSSVSQGADPTPNSNSKGASPTLITSAAVTITPLPASGTGQPIITSSKTQSAAPTGTSAPTLQSQSSPPPAQVVTSPASTKPLSGDFNNKGPEPVSGKVTIGKTTNGNIVLRLDNFNSAPGPDLFVYLSKNADPSNDAQVRSGSVEVGKLKATKGSQNYSLEGNPDLSQYKSVVVYCKSFSVIFGYANIS